MKVNFKKYFAILLMFFTIVIGTASWVIVGEKSFIAGQHSVSSAVAYIIGKESVKYTSIEKALDIAVSGEIVVVVPPKEKNYNNLDETPSKPDQVTYYITRDCEIKEGVSLVIPTDKETFSEVVDKNSLNSYIEKMYTDDRKRGTNASYNSFDTANASKYLKISVVIEENITLINNGTLIVSGYLSGGNNSSGTIGHTSHSYSRIIMNSSSRIIQNSESAKLYWFGYIQESSKNNDSIIDANDGQVYVPFTVIDYRGFNFLWAMTDGAIEEERCAPFNQFEFRNIDVQMKILYEAEIIGIVNVYVYMTSSIMNIDEVFTKLIKVIGKSSDCFIQFTDALNSYVYYKYNYDLVQNIPIAKIKLYGGLILNTFEFTLKASGQTIDLSTTQAYFPISFRYDVELCANDGQENAVFNFTKQRIKLLTGTKMHINKNVTVNSNEIIVYSSFYDGSSYNGKESFNGYNSVRYPLLKGAILKVENSSKINSTKLAGAVYGDASSFSVTTKEISAKEPWESGDNKAVIKNPAWIIVDYLVINEKLEIHSFNDLNKDKLYIGLNSFSQYNFAPALTININNNSEKIDVNKYQMVIHRSSISNYNIDFVSNIYKSFYSSNYYKKNSIIQYTESNSLICAINSTLSISNNLQGVNEFNIQKLEITCVTPEIDGVIPLYIEKSIQLKAVITDENKIYDKTETWISQNTEIATVDNNGNVTGHNIGDSVIQVTVDGKTATYTVHVLEEIEFIPIESVYITDSSGNSSEKIIGTTTNNDDGQNFDYNGKYGNNKTLTFNININSSNAQYKSILWTLTASAAGRQYINNTEQRVNTVENETSIKVYTKSGTNDSDDYVKLECVVTDLDDKTYKATFIINHQADLNICFTPDTLVTMGDGNQKQIKDIVPGEEILSFNHYTGKYESTKIAMLVNHGFDEYSILDLRFNNGERLKLINQHGLFDVELKKYVNITLENYKECIGRTYLQYDSKTNSNKEVILENINIETEYTEAYSILSSRNINAVTNNILSMSTGTPGIYNIFELDDIYMVDKELMLQDIEKYGLVTYEEYKDYVSYELFYDFNFEYLNISIAKGLITEEEIARQIEWYYQMIKNGEIII